MIWVLSRASIAFVLFSTFCKREGILLDFHSYLFTKGFNVFCFLSSLPLLPPATMAMFASYLSSPNS